MAEIDEKEWAENMRQELGAETIKSNPMLNYLVNGGKPPLKIVHISRNK